MKKNLLVLLCLLSLLSCQKEAPIPSKIELLTSQKWKWVGGTISPSYDIFGIGVLIGDDYFTRTPECWRDDVWVFSVASKFTHEEGATICNIGDSQIYAQGTWKFENEEASIRIIEEGKGQNSFVWSIQELSATSLKVMETFIDDGKTYKIQYTFGH
ncbi:hypothetical protein P1X15_02960 [Runella sp. MFBS21]|uniref:hypothetical protein n=1 Tax=Runella sp. MFBS21 TaxID=3034018 RepID=UPI0023F7B65C|nr:hypothetical protein [Runella sp. MFBS21]MDF7816532.1 hypothetical protein [Runella sp. MFBS21]